jgi:MFS transporter, ACDE family, multidrug resistance protein
VPEEDRTQRIEDSASNWRAGFGVLGAAFLFNLGQGVLRPSLPLYLRDNFAANYRMVTLIPVVFGAGKWVANLPTGYLLDRLGRRRLMIAGLLVIGACDVASIAIVEYGSFLIARAGAGVGWAMFATVATTAMINRAGSRGRAISLLLMAETLGLLVGSAAGGSLYAYSGPTSPFVLEASCMLMAAAVVGWFGLPGTTPPAPVSGRLRRGTLNDVGRVPGFLLMCCTSAALTGIQTGVLVFLFPVYLVEQGAVSPQTVGYLIALSVLGRLLALWFAGRVSDRRVRMSMLALGLAGFGVVLGTFVVVRGPALFGIWSVLLGAAAGFVAGLPTTIIGDRVDPSQHGIAIAWLRTATDAGMLVGPLVMGPLADAVDVTAPFLLAGIVSCALAWTCHRHALRTP